MLVPRAGRPALVALVGLAAAALTLGPTRSAARAGDWPQFRGPDGQGHAATSGVPLTWSETENVAWKVEIPGRGWSSPAVLGEQVWLTTATDEGRSLRAVAVDRRSGRILHNVEVFRLDEALPVNPKNSHASPSPVVEPGRVYVSFGTMGSAALDTATGQVLWTNRELTLDHKEGPGSSPVLWGELLIHQCDGMDRQYVAALDKRTGRLAWKTDRTGANDPNTDFRKAYSTPLVARVGDRELLLTIGADRFYAYDPASGRELWYVNYKGFSNVARPVIHGSHALVVTSYPRPQLWAVRLDPAASGDVTETHVAWKQTQQICASSSPLVVGDGVYMVTNKGVATCLDASSGENRWTERLDGNYWASPVLAEGRVYFFSEEGVATVIEAASEPRRLAENRLEGNFMATPAFVDGAIYVRTDTHLYRLEQGRTPQAAR